MTTRPARLAAALLCPLAAALLTACGGGGGGGTPLGTVATVTNATPDRLGYGRLSTFTVTGSNLTAVSGYTATGCDGLTLGSGGTNTQQTFSCTPNATLSVRVAATSGGGEVYAATLDVPKPRVTMATTLGSLVIELEPTKVQATVDNFLAYVAAGFYNGTIIHRVTVSQPAAPYSIVQGGGFTGVAGGTLTPQTGARAAIALETNKGLSNTRGSIGMARTSLPDTATSQFFFNITNNSSLFDYQSTANPGYAVFGTVVSGLSVLDTIDVVPTQTVGGFPNVPVTTITITSASRTL